MKISYRLISAFTDIDNGMLGNIAAIMMPDEPLNDSQMSTIAADLNQPATTFLFRNPDDSWNVRWFAPDAEIGLCGHGSLAAIAWLSKNGSLVRLKYKSGEISGKSHTDSGLNEMEIDAIKSIPYQSFDNTIENGIGLKVIEYLENDNKSIVLVDSESDVANMNPDFGILKNMNPFGIVVTAQGSDVDFVSRTLVPKVKQLEDHATGSSHAALVPFWSQKLGKQNLTALQLSPRGGRFECNYENGKVKLSGYSKLISEGTYYM